MKWVLLHLLCVDVCCMSFLNVFITWTIWPCLLITHLIPHKASLMFKKLQNPIVLFCHNKKQVWLCPNWKIAGSWSQIWRKAIMSVIGASVPLRISPECVSERKNVSLWIIFLWCGEQWTDRGLRVAAVWLDDFRSKNIRKICVIGGSFHINKKRTEVIKNKNSGSSGNILHWRNIWLNVLL